jgi:hypothetical protein
MNDKSAITPPTDPPKGAPPTDPPNTGPIEEPKVLPTEIPAEPGSAPTTGDSLVITPAPQAALPRDLRKPSSTENAGFEVNGVLGIRPASQAPAPTTTSNVPWSLPTG